MFGICIVAVVSIVAVALDYSRVSSAHKQTQNAVDAAMLSALAEVKRLQKLGHSDSSAKSAGLKFAKDSFEYHTKAVHEVVDLAFTPEITFVGTEIHGSSKVTANVELTIAKIMGKEFAPLDLESTVIIGGFGNTHIHFLVDISGSMGIGATLSDINTMDATINCAFACHSTVNQARAAGATLRYDVVQDAIINVINQLEAKKAGNAISVSVHGFSNGLSTRLSSESKMSTVRDAVNALILDFGQTRFQAALSGLNSVIPTPANSSKREVVVFVTDGYSHSEGVLNAAHCNAIKNDKSADLYTMNVVRLNPRTGQAEHNNASVNAALKACASDPSKAFAATTPQEIHDAFEALLEELEGDLRVSS